MARGQRRGGRRARLLAIAIGALALAAGALIPELVHGDSSPDDPLPTVSTIR